MKQKVITDNNISEAFTQNSVKEMIWLDLDFDFSNIIFRPGNFYKMKQLIGIFYRKIMKVLLLSNQSQVKIQAVTNNYFGDRLPAEILSV